MKRVITQSIFMLSLIVGMGAVAVAAEESVCLQCHSGLAGQLSEPIALWKTSVHAENSVSCHDCHGGDPTIFSMEAMSPDRGFIGVPDYEGVPKFCGRCHIGVKEDYDSSAHGLALDRGGAQCVLCHGNHAVKKADLSLINEESCSRCHEYDRAAKIRSALSEVDTAIADLDQQISQLYRVGIATREMSGDLFAVRNDFHRLFHNVDVEAVTAQSSSFLNRLDKIESRVGEIQTDLKQRKMVGGVVLVLLVVAGILFLMIRHTYSNRKKS
jgi:hypothetical protein